MTALRREDGVVVVEIAGQWLDRSALPDISLVEKALARGSAKALEFNVTGLDGWNSALMVRILAIHDLCAQAGVEFRAATLPAERQGRGDRAHLAGVCDVVQRRLRGDKPKPQVQLALCAFGCFGQHRHERNRR